LEAGGREARGSRVRVGVVEGSQLPRFGRQLPAELRNGLREAIRLALRRIE